MESLIKRIEAEAIYLGNGIVKVDGFINHQIDPELTGAMGRAFASALDAAQVSGITKVLTAEVSGIAPAVATGLALRVPVVYARKKRPITMKDGYFSAEAPSRTKGDLVRLMVSPEYLAPADRVVIIDDFLATGLTLAALADIVTQSGATLCAIGCVVEKVFEHGRQRLEALDVPVISLARIDLDEDRLMVSAG